MKKKAAIDGAIHAEGQEAVAPADTGNKDTEPAQDIIPHSAKALAGYHAALKSAAEYGESQHAQMEHPQIKKLFEKMIGQHRSHRKSMCKAFEEHHPDIEPPDGMKEDANLPEESEKSGGQTPSGETATRTLNEEKEPGVSKSLKKKSLCSQCEKTALEKKALAGDELSEEDEKAALEAFEKIEKRLTETENHVKSALGV